MAYISNDENQNEEDPQVSGGQTSAAMTAENSREVVGTRNPDSRGSGRFQDITKYIEANKPQVAALTDDVVNKVSTKAGDVRNTLQTETNKFQNQVNPEQTRLAAGENTINTALSNANQGVRTADNTEFFNLKNNVAPTIQSSTVIPGLKTQAQEVERLANLGQTSTGRDELLNTFYGSPSYTSGQRTLDKILMQISPGETNRLLQQSQAATKGLSQSVASQQELETQKLAELNARKLALQELANNQLNTQRTDLETQLRQALADRQNARQTQVTQADADIQAALKAGDFTRAEQILESVIGKDADLSQFKTGDYYYRGLDPYWAGQHTGGNQSKVNAAIQTQQDALKTALGQAEGLNLNTAVTDAERARYQALADLAQVDSSGRILGEENIAATPAGTFDFSQFNKYLDSLKNQQSTLESARQQTLNRYQKRDSDAYKIAQDMLKGVTPWTNSVTEDQINNYIGSRGYDRESWDRARNDLFNGLTQAQINDKLAMYARLAQQ